VLNIILIPEPQALNASKEGANMNVPLEAVLSFNVLYTADIAETYALFKVIKQPKGAYSKINAGNVGTIQSITLRLAQVFLVLQKDGLHQELLSVSFQRSFDRWLLGLT
jgi:hypothetical protein